VFLYLAVHFQEMPIMSEPIMNEPSKPSPTNSKQFDRVQAAIWRQDSQAGKSDKPLFTLTLSRSYRDANDEWQRSYSFMPRDLPHLQLAVEWAMRELLLKEE
jgi:hypothetical protein